MRVMAELPIMTAFLIETCCPAQTYHLPLAPCLPQIFERSQSESHCFPLTEVAQDTWWQKGSCCLRP
jgi:hypothetical protein